MSHALNVTGVSVLRPCDFKELYGVSVEVDGRPALVLIGKQETELGIDVLSGGDLMQFFKTDQQVNDLIREIVSKVGGT